MGVALSRGFHVSFQDVGTGPALVLVSGFAWPASSWVDLGYVDPLVRHGYRVLTVDPLGHGLSEKPHAWEAYQAPEIGSDIVAAMDAADVQRAVLWGYSRGAALVTMAATEHLDRVAALIVGGLTWIAPPPPQGGISPLVEALQRGSWSDFCTELGEPISDADRQIMEASDPRAMAAVDIARGRSTYAPDPTCIHVPTLLYYGSDDSWAPVDAAAKAFGLEPRMLPGHDHSGAFRDSESVLRIVLEFLADVYPACPESH
jgi:pimeloyl-ACP methyl ester carboxylesterase